MLIPFSDHRYPENVRRAFQKINHQLGVRSKPTFAELSLTGLTDNSLIYPSSNVLTSLGVAANGKIPIGSTGTTPVLAEITGTANQVISTPGAGSITLSLPQDIHTGANPTFAGLILSGTIAVGLNMSGGTFATADINLTANPIIQANGITVVQFDTTIRSAYLGHGVRNNDAGSENTFFGYHAGYNNDTAAVTVGIDGTSNVYIGTRAGAGETPLTGTVTLTQDSDAVVGNGTLFESEVVVGDIIRCHEVKWIYEVESITDDTHLTLTANHTDSTASGRWIVIERGQNNGNENVAIGTLSLVMNSTGYENTACGDNTLQWNTTGRNNCAFGNDALQWNVSGVGNTALGADALYWNVDGDYNVCIGYRCCQSMTSGNYNVIIGYRAGWNMDGVNSIIAIGMEALHEITSGETGNVAIGHQAGYYVNQSAGTEGEDNIYIGDSAGKGTATTNVGAFNIGIGKSALTAIQSGTANVSLGNSTGLVLTTGANNFLVGFEAGKALTTGNDNVFFGYQAGYKQTTSSSDLFIGYQAGYNNSGVTTGTQYNIAIGYQTFYNDNGDHNVGLGYKAGYYNDASGAGGIYNVYIGWGSGEGNVGTKNSGFQNVGLGAGSLNNNTTGNNCMAIGRSSLATNTTGVNNVAVGNTAMTNSTTSGNCVAIGYSALGFLQTKDHNVAIGYKSGYGVNGVSDFEKCVLLGSYSGTALTSGDYNLHAGYAAGLAATEADSCIYLGYFAGARQTTLDNRLIIDNQYRANIAVEETNAILYGIMAAAPANQSLRINAEILGSDGATIGDLAGNNFVIETDGTARFDGTATVWNDANLGVAQLALPVAAQPDEDEFIDEAGTDTGISTWAFAVGEKVSGSIEIPHDYKEGSDIYFHVHWQGITAPTGTDNVKWQCTYTVAQVDATLDAAVNIVVETAYDTQYEFKLSSCPAITGTNFNIGDQFLFTLERIVAVGDAYVGDALVATVGIHYECDTVGSRQMLTKA